MHYKETELKPSGARYQVATIYLFDDFKQFFLASFPGASLLWHLIAGLTIACSLMIRYNKMFWFRLTLVDLIWCDGYAYYCLSVPYHEMVISIYTTAFVFVRSVKWICWLTLEIWDANISPASSGKGSAEGSKQTCDDKRGFFLVISSHRKKSSVVGGRLVVVAVSDYKIVIQVSSSLTHRIREKKVLKYFWHEARKTLFWGIIIALWLE